MHWMKAFPREDHYAIFKQDAAVIPPSAESGKIVSPDHKGEGIALFTLMESIQGTDRIMGRLHPQLNVINADTQAGMALHRLDGGSIALCSGQHIRSILERILRGNDEIHAIESGGTRKVLHYGHMPHMKRIE